MWNKLFKHNSPRHTLVWKNSMKNSEVLSQAINEIQEFASIDSKEFEHALIYNPAPGSSIKH